MGFGTGAGRGPTQTSDEIGKAGWIAHRGCNLSELIQQQREFYDFRWQNSPGSAAEEARIEEILAAIPSDCKTILDVGAGDGRLSNRLAGSHFVVSLDLSVVGLRSCIGRKCCASVHQLPFSSRAFHAVVATEVLEHLPQELYAQALSEMSRVAERAIVATTPNRENLAENIAVCPLCGHRFHIWGHVRSYDSAKMAALFPGCRLVRLRAFGEKSERYNQLLLWVRQRLANAWASDAICPSCGHSIERDRRFVPRLCDYFHAKLWRKRSMVPSWLLAIFVKT